jgi:threonine dehydratase
LTYKGEFLFSQKKMKPINHIPTLEDIQETHAAIAPLIHRTPVLTCSSINEKAGASLFFKCENFQKVGAFKMRGAASAALRLTEAQKANGLATHSSGNHAQAVARAAQVLGIPAYIVMPENAPAIKRAATEGYAAKIISCAPTIQAREKTLEKVVAETGASFIHPYNDYNVIAGQATCAKELLEEVTELDAIIAPIGGGGLMSGTALSTSYLSPKTIIYGSEPEKVNDAWRSFHSGRIEHNDTIDTIADGLRTDLGPKTFAIIRNYLEDIFTVSEEEIIAAMRLVWERMKIIIEPSCAVPLATILKNPPVFRGKRVGVILTGGNVDLEHLPW